MKASEIKADGYHWAWLADSWDIIHCADGFITYPDGSTERISCLQHDFTVVGPITPPEAPWNE